MMLISPKFITNLQYTGLYDETRGVIPAIGRFDIANHIDTAATKVVENMNS